MSLFYLARPKAMAFRNGLRSRDRRSLVRAAVMALLGLLFWSGAFLVFYRALLYFKSAELIGDLLAFRVLELVFITLSSVLLFSNVITALSTLYLSREMELILASPVKRVQVYVYKFIETAAVSSWMVAVFGLPVLLSYGLVYHAGALFYLASPPVLVVFMLVPAPVGMMFAMALVRMFPAKRTKDIMFFLSVVLVVTLYFLARFVQPEKLVNPEEFGKVAGYIASLRGASNPYLPGHWAAMTLWPLIKGGARFDPFWPLMLLSTAGALFVIAGWVFDGIFHTGYSRAQEGGRHRTYGLLPSGSLLDRLAGPVRGPVKALVVKDVKTFFRDSSQWSQLFLLGALVVVYIYNYKVLPLDRLPFATFFLQNAISFLNLALAGFVLAAVAARFVFPAVSLERDSFWILKSSPLGLRGFLWAKFWSAWAPLLVLAEALVLLSNHYLKAGTFMTALSAAAIFLISFGITGLGVGLGAMYPRFRFENAAQISAGYGGIVYMLFAMGFVSVAVSLLAWPAYAFLGARLRGVPLTTSETAVSAGCILLAAAINAAACIVPMEKGLRSLEGREI